MVREPLTCALASAAEQALEACRRHISAGCEDCRRVVQELLGLTPELQAARGRVGGAAGRGEAKRRGDSEHYRALAARRKRPGRRPKKNLDNVKREA
jgi:hypothetical protein